MPIRAESDRQEGTDFHEVNGGVHHHGPPTPMSGTGRHSAANNAGGAESTGGGVALICDLFVLLSPFGIDCIFGLRRP